MVVSIKLTQSHNSLNTHACFCSHYSWGIGASMAPGTQLPLCIELIGSHRGTVPTPQAFPSVHTGLHFIVVQNWPFLTNLYISLHVCSYHFHFIPLILQSYMYCTCPTWIYGSTKYIAAHVCILYIICVCLLEVTSCKRYIFLFVQCHAMPAHEGCFPCKTSHSHRIRRQAPVYILLSTVQDTHAVFCIIYILYSKSLYLYTGSRKCCDGQLL